MNRKSFIDPYYSSGKFFQFSTGAQDAHFKVEQLRVTLTRYFDRHPGISLLRVADVGCGKGTTTFLLRDMLHEMGHQVQVSGYDVHPYVDTLPSTADVSFYAGDFLQLNSDVFDLIVLFDVIEHIPNPLEFLQEIGQRASLVALHIPLDNSWLLALRNTWKVNLLHPGHLIILDVPSALNLLSFSALRVEDYIFTPVFRAPS